ncbi:MAG: hypothetical protein WCJ40_10710 [Planctomycetota bacterium]|nr:hypothetical protein [Planctomycetota bacterium]
MSQIFRIFAIISIMGIPTIQADQLVLVAGGGSSEPPCDARSVKLKEPFYTEADPQGGLIIAEMAEGQRILRLESSGKLTLLAGTGTKGKPVEGNQNALDARFDGIHNIAIHPVTGDIYIADTWNCVIRKYQAATKTVSTIAGTGLKGFSGDGNDAMKASLGGIYCVALDPEGRHLYMADLHNYCIRVLDLETGMIRRAAGNGKRGKPVNGGIAIQEPLIDPRAVVVDRFGNLYILERGGNALRVVNSDGKIRTVVNESGKKGRTRESGPALSFEMNGPKHIQIDRNNRVLIADAENHQVLRYDPRADRVEILAGTGIAGTGGLNGPPTKAQLNRPHGLFELQNGQIIITDSYNHRILKIEK